VEEPVVEERAETQKSILEDSATSAKEPVPEALENIQEVESTEQTIEPTPLETIVEEPSRGFTAEPIVEDVTAVAPESSPLQTEEPAPEPLEDVVPEIVEPSDKPETESAGKGIVDLPKSSEEPDIMPQPEMIVEDVSATEPRVENTKEEIQDLPRETVNTPTALTC
jgi:hypothetical protein